MSQLKYWDGTAWVNAVIGAQGTNGTNGAQGTTGAGIQGTTGTQGTTGSNGAQGTTGAQGISGATVPNATRTAQGVVYGLTQTEYIAGGSGENGITALGNYSVPLGSGLNSTSIGVQSLSGLAIGSGNTAVGAYAGNNLLMGGNNIIIGADAETSSNQVSNEITIGNENIARLRIPGLDLDTSTAGGGLALGWNSQGGSAGTGGFEWVLAGVSPATPEEPGKVYGTFGGEALNTSIGYLSLNAITDGTDNAVFGSQSGTTITTGDNNIILGNNTEATSATVSNEVTIGNSSINRFRVPGIGLDTAQGTNGQVLTKTGSNTVGWANSNAPLTGTFTSTLDGTYENAVVIPSSSITGGIVVSITGRQPGTNAGYTIIMLGAKATVDAYGSTLLPSVGANNGTAGMVAQLGSETGGVSIRVKVNNGTTQTTTWTYSVTLL